jgi:hypothetical protein
MKTPAKILLTTLFVASCTNLQARFVTLTVNGNPVGGPVNLLAQLNIHSNEVATVLASSTDGLTVIKDGLSLAYFSGRGSYTIAGPAVFQLTSNNGIAQDFCTIEITPESFPPDKTLIIPQGTGAKIIFECSTNLLDWAPVWQGTYTNAPPNKFFRIRADRLP